MLDKKLTDAEIINDLEERIEFAKDFESDFTLIKIEGLKSTLGLINRLKAENKKNENIIRLADKTIATQNAEIEKLRKIKVIYEIVDYCAGDLEDALKEIDRLKAENKILSENADSAFQDGLNEARDLYAEEVKSEVKAGAVKEFAERLCEDRLPNDPVVIAVKTELKMMRVGED